MLSLCGTLIFAKRKLPRKGGSFTMMYMKTLLLALVSSIALVISKDAQLQVGVKYKPDECPLKTRKGDKLSMQ